MANRQYQQMNPEENANYYQESCKLYLANVLLTCQLKELLNEKNELLDKIERLEKSQKRRTAEESNNGVQGGGSNSNFANDKKRIRRAASQIERNYRCPVANCEKSYGSENSLIQHVKIKHPEADIKQVISQINIQQNTNIQNDDQSQDYESSQQQKKQKNNEREEDDDEEEDEDEDDE
ncbi:hypothetical protein ABPG72_019410 [Tetrahymena utriculariae]